MVSALLSDALSNPIDSVREFYGTYTEDPVSFADGVASHYQAIFASKDALRQVGPP